MWTAGHGDLLCRCHPLYKMRGFLYCMLRMWIGNGISPFSLEATDCGFVSWHPPAVVYDMLQLSTSEATASSCFLRMVVLPSYCGSMSCNVPYWIWTTPLDLVDVLPPLDGISTIVVSYLLWSLLQRGRSCRCRGLPH